jgi:hypothetical protein
MPRFASIVSTGRYIPEIEVSNDELRERFAHIPDFVDKMEDSSEIRTRWWAPEDWCTSDIALPAAQQALEKAGRKPEDVDLIILGTDSPDYITPATSVVLQHKLGAINAGTFDVGCACASFPTGAAIGADHVAPRSVDNSRWPVEPGVDDGATPDATASMSGSVGLTAIELLKTPSSITSMPACCCAVIDGIARKLNALAIAMCVAVLNRVTAILP